MFRFALDMAESLSVHVPVLLDAVVQWLDPRPGIVMVDGTLGGGGHARALLERVGPNGLVIAIDRDPEAIDRCQQQFQGMPVRLAQANYCDLPEVLERLNIKSVDGVVLDLGISSDQLADVRRGFSFSLEGPLDLRFDPSSGEPARRLINRLSAEHLAELIFHFGEERYSRRIARAIVEERRHKAIETSQELAELIRRSVPRPPRGERIDPATRTFQALRIAVNDELKSLEIGLRRIPDCLRPGGRMAVISFHSLEDRRVKEAFRNDQRLKNLTSKPIRAEAEEIDRNPRCRSAKLRVAERV
ncbi:MAG: 16S rRNA (cytosine(1402)-N(4))-methyltransferase RsmH [Thermoguttaceae bacterium]|jgi:16S rRNA (cytosine1402-N4)-methyltransferase